MTAIEKDIRLNTPLHLPVGIGSVVTATVLLLLLLAGCGGDKQASPQDLKQELVAMQTRSNELRQRVARLGPDHPEMVDSLNSLDSTNTARLKEIVDNYGWPTAAMVGKDGVRAAFRIAQFASDPGFQQRCVPFVHDAAVRGELPLEAEAILTDRALLAAGKPQRYGTQFELVDYKLVPQPLENELIVDSLRAEMDLPPLEQYRQMLRQYYEPPDSLVKAADSVDSE